MGKRELKAERLRFLGRELSKRDAFRQSGVNVAGAACCGILGAALGGAAGIGIGMAADSPRLSWVAGFPLASVGGILGLKLSNRTGFSGWRSRLDDRLASRGYSPLSSSEIRELQPIYEAVNGDNSDYMPRMIGI